MGKKSASLLFLACLAGCRGQECYTHRDLQETARKSYERGKQEEKKRIYEAAGEAYLELLLERQLDLIGLSNACGTIANFYRKQGDEKTAEEYELRRDIYRKRIGIIEENFKGEQQE
jgi:hypothetical protein